MSDPSLPVPDGDDLIFRPLDNQLSEAEFVLLDEKLRRDAAFRERFVRMADLDAGLYDELSEAASTIAAVRSVPKNAAMRPIVVWGVLAAVMVLIVTPWVSILKRDSAVEVADSGPSSNLTPARTNNPALSQTGAGDSASPKIEFIVDELLNAKVAAILVQAEGEHNGQFVPGYRFRSGILNLKEGYVHLEFVCGAIVGLTGPAELRIEFKDAATIVAGQVVAHVPDRAKGFVLNAPSAAIVDLGTDFGVRIGESGDAEVEVHKGEVELSLLRDDGSTLLSERINQSKAVRVDRSLHKLTETNQASEPYPSLRLLDDKPLLIPDEYVKSVLDGQPLIYWRFEGADQRRFSNEVGDRLSATVHAVDQSSESIHIADGHARFSRSTSPRFLSVDDEIPGLNEHAYSIEFWMKPDDLTHSTCIGIQPLAQPAPEVHLNVIEIATETFLIHEPGAIRFLHRNPPDKLAELGTNVFSQGVGIPHQWQYIVAVKTLDSIELYFSGQLARRVNVADANGSGDYRTLVGQLKRGPTERE